MGGGLECMESLRVTSWAEGGGAERDIVVDDMARAGSGDVTGRRGRPSVRVSGGGCARCQAPPSSPPPAWAHSPPRHRTRGVSVGVSTRWRAGDVMLHRGLRDAHIGSAVPQAHHPADSRPPLARLAAAAAPALAPRPPERARRSSAEDSVVPVNLEYNQQ